MGNYSLTKRIIGLAIDVHKELGPGLLENTYKQCLAFELRQSGIDFEVEKEIPVNYKGQAIECGYRVDFLIQNELIIELKSMIQLHPVHEAQILTYMRHAKVNVGLLINFGEKLLRNGIKRFVL